jgi:3-oxoacyl-[acyl-carrier protein] reductase
MFYTSFMRGRRSGPGRFVARAQGSVPRVNGVAPGLTLNERVAKRLENLQEDRRAALTAAVPLGRLGDSDEIAAAIAFLAGDASSYITGATIDVNGERFMM